MLRATVKEIGLMPEGYYRGGDEEREQQTRAVLVTGSFAAYVHFRFPVFISTEMMVPQLEIPILLSLHRHNPVRSPQITRH